MCRESSGEGRGKLAPSSTGEGEGLSQHMTVIHDHSRYACSWRIHMQGYAMCVDWAVTKAYGEPSFQTCAGPL